MFGGKLLKNKKKLWLSALCVLVVVLAGVAIYPFFIQKQATRDHASDMGQRITMLLETGEILEGNLASPASEKESHGERADTAHGEAEITHQGESGEQEVFHQRNEGEHGAGEEHVQNILPSAVNEGTHSDSHGDPEEKSHDNHAAEIENPAVSHKNAPVVRPKIAIMLGGLGLSGSTTERALTLPSSITMGFSPYAHDMAGWLNQAKEDGHEVFVNMPVEPVDYPADDTGPYALLTNLSAEKNIERLSWVLSRAEGYAGIYTTPSEKFTYSQKSMTPVLEYMQKKHLLFVYGDGYNNNMLLQLSKKLSQPLIVRDFIIDEQVSAVKIEKKLRALEETARVNGFALGIGNPYPITIKILERWLPALAAKVIDIVPISQLPR